MPGAPASGDPTLGNQALGNQALGNQTPLNQTGANPDGVTLTRRTQSAPVSADQLRHPLIGKALRLIQKAESLIHAGDHQRAIEELRRDVKNSQAEPYARSLLGEEYIRAKNYGEAIPELEEAVRLLPSNVTDHANLGYALLLTGRLEPAEHELTRALELQPNNPQTHLVLGVLRFCQGERDQEAEEQLELAARELPNAHLILAKFYRLTGRPQAGDRELQTYLRASGAADSAALEEWLGDGALMGTAGTAH